MKIRNGFISNSSSCSFCIYGLEIDKENYDKLEETLKSNLLQLECGEYDTYYIGAGIDVMEMDETKRQFYQRVENELKELGFNTSKITWWEEAWYDG